MQKGWEEARTAYSLKKYSEAEQLYSTIISETKDIRAIYNRAICNYYLKQYQKVMDDIKAIEGKYDKHKLLSLRDKAREAMKKTGVSEKTETDEDGLIKSLAFFKSDIKFKDIIGCEKAKDYFANNVVLAMKRPDLFQKYKKKMGEAIILYGPSGSGKTYLSKAVAGEADANMIIVRINQLMNLYVGNTEKNLHKIFDFARQHLPCIIFIDEIDGITMSRGGGGDSGGDGQVMRRLVNELLQELDGIEKNPEGLFVLASTNRPWDIDPAFKRSGRFSTLIYIAPPSFKDRVELFKYYLKDKLSEKLNFTQLAMLTSDYSQADLARLSDMALMEPIINEYKKGQERKLNQQDIALTLNKIMPKGSLQQWFLDCKGEILGKEVITVVDGKEQKNWKPGNMDNQERRLYEPLLKDIDRYTNTRHQNMGSVMKFIAGIVS